MLEILLHNMRELVVSAYVFRVTGTSTTVADQCVQVRGIVHDSCKFPQKLEMYLGVKTLQSFKEHCGLLNGIELCFTGALVVIM